MGPGTYGGRDLITCASPEDTIKGSRIDPVTVPGRRALTGATEDRGRGVPGYALGRFMVHGRLGDDEARAMTSRTGRVAWRTSLTIAVAAMTLVVALPPAALGQSGAEVCQPFDQLPEPLRSDPTVEAVEDAVEASTGLAHETAQSAVEIAWGAAGPSEEDPPTVPTCEDAAETGPGAPTVEGVPVPSDPRVALDRAWCHETTLDGDARVDRVTVETGSRVTVEGETCRMWSSDWELGDWGTTAEQAVVGPDGEVAYTASLARSSGTHDAYGVSAVDAATGELVWTRTYEGETPRAERIAGMVLDPEGDTLVVAGEGWARYVQEDYLTLAVDTESGDVLWTDQHDGAGDWDFVRSVAMGPDGETVYVTGSIYNTGWWVAYETIAYDADTGEVQWTAREIDGRAHAIAADPDGETVYVTGTGWNRPDVIAYDAETGERQWTAEMHEVWDRGSQKIAVDADADRLLVSGTTVHPRDRPDEVATLAFASDDGARLWKETVSSEADRDAASVGLDIGADGGVYVAGWIETDDAGKDQFSLRYDGDGGNETWRITDDAGTGGDDVPTAIEVGPDGDRVYLASNNADEEGINVVRVTSRTAATGERVWTDTTEEDEGVYAAHDLALSPDGDHAYAAGAVTEPGEAAHPMLLGYATGAVSALEHEATSAVPSSSP